MKNSLKQTDLRLKSKRNKSRAAKKGKQSRIKQIQDCKLQVNYCTRVPAVSVDLSSTTQHRTLMKVPNMQDFHRTCFHPRSAVATSVCKQCPTY